MIKISNEPLNEPIECFKGAFKEPCVGCVLASVCIGCRRDRQIPCEQKQCFRDCNDCGGGPLRYTGANVPAVCCKAPHRNLVLPQVRKDSYTFKKRKYIDLEQSSIIITQGSPGRVDRCPYPEGTSAIAVNLRHVWSQRGWFSSDLRDYLKLEDRKTKLILLTATHDDVLERASDAEVAYDDFAAKGFDYWQALEFSQYGDMGNFNSLWQSYRTLHAIEASKAHFVDMIPTAIRSLNGPEPYAPWAQLAEAVPQVMINWQFNSLNNPANYRMVVALVKRHLKLAPARALWFIGVVSAAMVYNLQRTFSDYRCYFLSVNPWLAAHKGDEFSEEGKLHKSKLPKTDLVLQNQRNYANLVLRAVTAAKEQSR
jgi:hypothetical protein